MLSSVEREEEDWGKERGVMYAVEERRGNLLVSHDLLSATK